MKNISYIVDCLLLHDSKKDILKRRYLEEVRYYINKSRQVEIIYITLSLFITIGSITLPAMLSIQQLQYSADEELNQKYRDIIYWITWCLSLIISIFNGIIQLFSLHKQYISYNNTKEKMLAEGWQYFQLSGEYYNTTHEESFNEFCEEIEEIKKNQVDKELHFLNPQSTVKRKKKNNKLDPEKELLLSDNTNNKKNVNIL